MERSEKLKIIEQYNKLRTGQLADLWDAEIPQLPYIINDVVPAGKIMAIFGAGGHFKSSLCLHLALCMASGTDTFRWRVNEQTNVLWIDEEMGMEGYSIKSKQIGKGLGLTSDDIRGKFHYKVMTDFKMDSKVAPILLDNEVVIHNVGVIVIDSVTRVSTVDENHASEVRVMHDILRKLCEKYALTVIFIHHTPHGVDRMRGSVDFKNMIDGSFFIKQLGSKSNKYRFVEKKSRYKAPENKIDINFSVDNEDDAITLKYEGTTEENVTSSKETATNHLDAWLSDNKKPGDTIYTKEYKADLKSKGNGLNAINDAPKSLCERNILMKVKKGQYTYVGH